MAVLASTLLPKDTPNKAKTLAYDALETIDLNNVMLNGGLLVKILDISMDPYLRAKLRDPRKKPYSAPFSIGESIENNAIAVVLRSENWEFKKEEYVFEVLPFMNYAVVNDTSKLHVIDNKYSLP